jgi:hypothetical protein
VRSSAIGTLPFTDQIARRISLIRVAVPVRSLRTTNATGETPNAGPPKKFSMNAGKYTMLGAAA